MKILSAEQLRYVDAYTIEHESMASSDLMEHASMEFSLAFMSRWNTETPVVVFAGSGNNGGDALAISRLLAKQGFHVETYLFNTGKTMSADCMHNYKRLQETNVKLHEVKNSFTPPKLDAQHVVIDGLFGTGLTRPLSGGFAAVVRYINASPATVVSIDVPSGLMTEDNSFNVMTNVVKADYTFTFHSPKLAFLFPENQQYVGEWIVLDIGIVDPDDTNTACTINMMEQVDIQPLMKKRSRFAHKGQMGHALLVAGSEGMAGAAVLSSRATIRSGVGKLTVMTPDVNRSVLQISVPEAIVCTNVESVATFDSIGVGPGIGVGDEATEQLLSILQLNDMPLVLDADALNILAANPTWIQQLPAGTIITPHRREMERLLGGSYASHELMEKAHDLAMNYQLNIVLKGAFTQVFTSDGQIYINTTGNAGMATAGSGDVLTGIILGLLARQYTPDVAVRLGVYLHGLAGDFASAELGEESLIASDIINYLPQAFLKIQKQ